LKEGAILFSGVQFGK